MKKTVCFLLTFLFCSLLQAQDILFPTVGNVTVSSCSGTVYDSGGPTGLYSPSENGVMTIAPTGATSVSLIFTELTIEGEPFDILTIYDGADINSPLIGSYGGYDYYGGGFTLPNDGEPIISTGGAITLAFVSDPSVQQDGFTFSFEAELSTTSPIAGFSTDTDVTCGGTIQFEDVSCNDPTSWSWDFGDGNTSTEKNPSHTYSEEGTYTVTMTSCVGDDCDSTSNDVTYNSQDASCFEFSMPNIGTSVTESCIGTLFDSGGEFGFYSPNENGVFVINPPAAAIEFSFESVLVEQFPFQDTDVITVYDGDDTFSPIIGIFDNLNGNTLNVGETYTATSGALTIRFTSNAFNEDAGFKMSWSSITGTAAPAADFEIVGGTEDQPFGTPIQFNDLSTEQPGEWMWDFGDGETSNEQNPQHAYQFPGNFIVNLIVANCVGDSDTATQTINIQTAPFVSSWTPDSFFIELESGTSTTETITMTTSEGGELTYNIEGPNNSFAGAIAALMYDFQSTNQDDIIQVDNLQNLLQSSFGNLFLTTTTTTDAEELENLLTNTNVFIVPGLEGAIDANPFIGFQEVLNSFVEGGGTVLFTGTFANTAVVSNSGLFEITNATAEFDPLLTMTDPTHPLAEDIPELFQGKVGAISYSLAGGGFTSLINFEGRSMAAYNEIGEGKAILLGFNYYYYQFSEYQPLDQLLINSIAWGGLNEDAQWLFVDPEVGTVPELSTTTIDVLFDATNAPAGTYETDIVINTNDPDHPQIIIPAVLVVTGAPDITVNTDVLDFGNVVQFTSETLSFEVTNSGSDTLFVTGININNDAFTTDIEGFFLYPGFTQTVEITFSPIDIEEITSLELIVENNDEPYTILINANATGAPVSTANPQSIDITLDAGATGSATFDINNPGQGFLDYVLSSTLSGDNTGFIFDFTTDVFNNEFFWQLVDSEGNVVLSQDPIYSATTPYTEILGGLSPTEEYTLILMDTFGDGSLDSYTVTDITTGTVVASGDFTTGAEVIVPLGFPTQNPIDQWMTFDPNSGEIDFPNGSQTITVNFDATNLIGGVYETTIIITSNDPVTPTVTINVTLTVIGIPSIQAPAEALDFGSLIVGLDNTQTFEICNEGGTDNLIVSNILAGNQQYDITPTNLNIPPNECGTVTITFAPDEQGNWDTDLTIFNNTSGGEVTVSLIGTGQGAPLASVTSTDGIEITLQAGESSDETITIFNNGQGNLDFTLPTGQPGFISFGTQNGTVDFPGEEEVIITLDATGLTADVYTYNIIIQTNDPQNPTLTVPVTLNVIAFPQAVFQASSTVVCGTDIAVQFTDFSVNVPTEWLWDFGDGTTSTEQNPTHIYTESGTYSVTLTATNDLGSDEVTIDDYITVDLNCIDAPIPGGNNQTVFGCIGNLYDSGGAGGNYVNNADGCITVTSPGAESFDLDFSEFNYESGFDSIYVYSGDQAVPSQLFGAYSGNALPGGGSLNVTGTAFTICETSDGSASLSGFALTFTCNQPQAPPTAAFSSNTTSLCSGLVVFSNESSLGTSYEWDFGDGNTSNNPNPTHQYTESGTYEVVLTTSNGLGDDTATETLTLDVLLPDVTICIEALPGEEIQFSDNTTNATSWLWTLGNGQISSQQNPTVTYADEGTYNVTVSIVNTDVSPQCLVEYTQEIVVSSSAAEACVVTGVEDLDNNLIKLYPNPTTGIVQVELNIEKEKDLTLKVTDMMGKLVKEQQVDVLGQKTIQLDLSNQSNGTYFVTLQSNTAHTTQKVVLQR